MRGWALLWLTLTGAPQVGPPAGARVQSDAACFDSDAATARLERVLANRGPHLRVLVRARAADPEWTLIELEATDEQGDVVLERRYRLSAADCPSAPELLALVLEQFLAGLPGEPWGPRRTFELSLRLVGLSEWAPLGADGELAVAADIAGARHALATSLAVRAAAPHELGGGSFQDTTFMAGAGWRLAGRSWRNRLELRAGAMLVTGYGFAAPQSTWLPWLEVADSLEYRWENGWALGLFASLSPLEHTAVTIDRSASQSLSIFRFGLVLSMPLWSRNF